MKAQKTEDLEDIEGTTGSGNVFKDMGFPDADERLAKARLAMRINGILEQRKLSKVKAAKTLEINQTQLFDLMNGRLSGFPMKRLLHFLRRLNQDIDMKISIKARRGRPTTHGKLEATIN